MWAILENAIIDCSHVKNQASLKKQSDGACFKVTPIENTDSGEASPEQRATHGTRATPYPSQLNPPSFLSRVRVPQPLPEIGADCPTTQHQKIAHKNEKTNSNERTQKVCRKGPKNPN